MDWIEEIPVGLSGQAAGEKGGGLTDNASLLLGDDLKFQPRAPRKFHQCAEPQKTVRLKRLDSPKVNGIPDRDALWVVPAATPTHSAHKPIQHGAEIP